MIKALLVLGAVASVGVVIGYSSSLLSVSEFTLNPVWLLIPLAEGIGCHLYGLLSENNTVSAKEVKS